MNTSNIHPEYASIVEKYTTERHPEFIPDPTEDPEVQEAANVDRFGFYHPNGVDEKEESEEKKQQQARRLEKWREMTNRWEDLDSNWRRIFRNGRATEKLTRRIFKGIPQQFRMIVWPLLLCVPDVKYKNKNLYSKMLNRALATSNDLGQIDLDINRTFRNTTYFRARYGSRQQALFRILAAYSVFNTEVGYCQGMSELVGLLLTYIIEEEDAFWALSQLMTGPRHRLHGIFVSGFPGLQRLFTHHEHVVKRLLPPIHKHFTEQQMATSTYALKWFMQCFLDRLPVSLVLRLWDIYLLEGERILIAMAFNILKMHKKRLLRMDQTQITCFFQDDLAKNFEFDDDVVIESLKDCLELLRRNKLDQPPPPTADMLPRRSIGSLGPESVWQSQPNLRIYDKEVEIRGPSVKPSLNVPPPSDGSLRPRRRRETNNRDVALSPIPQRGPLKLPTQFASNLNSQGFASPASILTAAAVQNRYRGSDQSNVHQQTGMYSAPSDDLQYSHSASTSTSSSVFTSDTNYVPRQGSYPIRSQSPKFLRARLRSDHSPSLRFSLGHQISPSTSTSTSGYATTEGRRHRFIQNSPVITPTFSVELPPSPAPSTSRDRTLQPTQTSSSNSQNGVVLISVRPRHVQDGQQASQAVTKAFERIYLDKPPMSQPKSNIQVGQWSSERVLFADPPIARSNVASPPRSITSDLFGEPDDEPWRKRPIIVQREETGNAGSGTNMTTHKQGPHRHTSVSRVEYTTTCTRDVFTPVSHRPPSGFSSSRPRVLRVDSRGRPLSIESGNTTPKPEPQPSQHYLV